jgi:hypothetical protein
MNMEKAPTGSGPLLGRAEAARYLGIAPATLAVWASTKRYPLPLVKIGRCVKYRIQDLDHFIASRTVGFAATTRLD